MLRQSSILTALGVLSALAVFLPSAGLAAEQGGAAVLSNAPAASPAGVSTNVDLAAARYATMCAGCHSLTGAKLTGPDLTPSMAWPLDQLKAAIKRMEKNVGPLSDEQVEAQARLLQSPDVRQRVQAEQERIQAQFMARMAPADAGVGRSLFFGSIPLRNGGLACVACHAVAGQGGNLGVDLTGVFAKMGGQTPLVSAIEKSAFKIMAPHYQRHPVTPQEALHLAKYLSTLDPKEARPVRAAFVPAGAGLAAALLLGLTLHARSQRARRGRNTPLRRRRF